MQGDRLFVLEDDGIYLYNDLTKKDLQKSQLSPLYTFFLTNSYPIK